MGILVATWLLSLPLSAAAATVECTDPSTGDKKKVAVAKVQGGLKAVRQRLQKLGVHLLDLPEAVQERHQNLAQFTSEKNWCALNSHVVALEDALRLVRLDRAFVSDKFGRIERWVRARESTEKRDELERLMANAAAQMADQRFDKANDLLNRTMAILFGSGDTWRLPEPMPQVAAGEDAATGPSIERAEVQAGCPLLAKQAKASRDDLRAAAERLGKQLDKRRLRPLDLKGGEALIADYQSYLKLNAWWPATRVVCALTERAKNAEIDLGLVSKRFQRVKNLHEAKPLGDADETRFKELVRGASQNIIDQKFDEAHAALDELLVLLGEPARPSVVFD